MASGLCCFSGLEFDIGLCMRQVEERDVCSQAYLLTTGNIPRGCFPFQRPMNLYPSPVESPLAPQK